MTDRLRYGKGDLLTLKHTGEGGGDKSTFGPGWGLSLPPEIRAKKQVYSAAEALAAPSAGGLWRAWEKDARLFPLRHAAGGAGAGAGGAQLAQPQGERLFRAVCTGQLAAVQRLVEQEGVDLAQWRSDEPLGDYHSGDDDNDEGDSIQLHRVCVLHAALMFTEADSVEGQQAKVLKYLLQKLAASDGDLDPHSSLLEFGHGTAVGTPLVFAGNTHCSGFLFVLLGEGDCGMYSKPAADSPLHPPNSSRAQP